MDSEEHQETGNFYNDEAGMINGSISSYFDGSTDQTIQDNVLYVKTNFDDKHFPSDEFDTIEVVITYLEDDTDTFSVTIDPNDVDNPVETTAQYSYMIGKTYKVETIGYDSLGNPTTIFYEEIEFAGA